MSLRFLALETAQQLIKHECLNPECPKILREISTLFRIENYIYFDTIMLWFNTLHLMRWQVTSQMLSFATTIYRDLKNTFDGSMMCDPLYNDSKFLMYYRQNDNSGACSFENALSALPGLP